MLNLIAFLNFDFVEKELLGKICGMAKVSKAVWKEFEEAKLSQLFKHCLQWETEAPESLQWRNIYYAWYYDPETVAHEATM